MAEFPAMPIWTDAFLADCGHLDDAERGRYFLLMMLMWRAPGQRLPNDDVWLARRFTRPVEAFRQEVKPIIDEFCQSDGNWITQKRLLREWNFVKKQSDKQSARARSRWQKEKHECRGNATTGNAPTPTPTYKEKRETKVSPKRGVRLDENWTLSKPLGDWAISQGLTEKQARDQADRFRDYWIAQPGQKGVKVDWGATWRNWVRNEISRNGLNGSSPPTTGGDSGTMAEIKRRQLAELGGGL